MKKSLRIFITAAICIFSVTAAAADDWKVVFLKHDGSNTHKGVAFYKNGKKAFALTDWEMPRTMVFVKQDRKNPSHFAPVHIYSDMEKSFKYQDYLLDIKGDGDYRYLIVYNYHGGNSPLCEDGYLIDTKDNFAIIGRVGAGSESCSYSYPNPEFTFYYCDEIAYFGASGAAWIGVALKIQKGKEPVLVSTVAREDSDEFKYMFQNCREILADKDRPQNREIAFANLYCDLASYGLLKDLNKYAKQLGFADDEIKEYRNYYLERIKESRFYKYIYKLNRPEDFADDWEVVFLTDKESNKYNGVEFHKNGKKAFGLKFNNTDSFMSSIGFMVPLDDYKNGFSQRFIYKGIDKSNEKSFNYKDYLIDLKGNGDKRYLLIGSYGGGNRGPYDYGYLIDTKDNFAVIGRVSTGEVMDYPMPNHELIFKYYDTIEHFSRGAEASVFIKYKLQKGKMPLLVEQAGDIKSFALESYEKILEDKNWSDARNYALATLYCDLASEGLLKHFCTSAQSLGFSNEEIADTSEYYGEKLRKSKLYKYIKKLNGNLQIRQLISDDEAFLQDWLSLIADSDMAGSAIMNWSRDFSYNVEYVGNGFVSYYCRADYYTGGAHENHDIKVGTLYRGKELRLADLPELDKIEKLFQQALRSRKDFEGIKTYNCGKEVKMTENFYIDEKGIHFVYEPYEIHWYGAGIIDIFVPYKVDFSAK